MPDDVAPEGALVVAGDEIGAGLLGESHQALAGRALDQPDDQDREVVEAEQRRRHQHLRQDVRMLPIRWTGAVYQGLGRKVMT